MQSQAAVKSAVLTPSMPEPCEAIRVFVLNSRIFPEDEEPVFEPLTGGVASDIWKVTAGSQVIVVKQALARLRVAQEWRAPVSRNASEMEWLTEAGQIVPDAVPAVLAHDPAAGAFAMTYFDPASHPVWKTELRQGRVDPAAASRVAALLVAIHNRTAARDDIARRFDNDTVFHAIRLEPYIEATALRHPDLRDALLSLSRDTLKTKRALVHGDVSPKNILIGPKSPVLLDAECAWYGDPAFDVAFCLNHLLLKAILRPDRRDALQASFKAFADTYFHAISFEPRDVVEIRTARLLPALLLARVDGKSPVEYVTAEADRERIRRVARPLIARPPIHLSIIAARWAEEFPI